MLWTALLFPALPLEREAGPGDVVKAGVARARAIVQQTGPQRSIMSCDDAARTLGIRPGLSVKSALAIEPGLELIDFDEHEQAAQLAQLALWALGYSSRVTPHPPDTLLMEVQGSLRLFGGLDALLARLHDDAASLGLSLHLGTAPTPSSAALLARAGIERPVRTSHAIPMAIAHLPIDHLALETDVRQGLGRSGLNTLGQLAGLPPASLTRRFGHRLVEMLYRLDGRLPDPQAAIVPPPTFREAADLPLEAESTAGLAFLLRRLLAALGGFLRSRDVGVRRLDVELFHHRHAPSVVSLRFLEAATDVAHLYRIATERLDGTVLVAPVTRLAVHASELAEVERAAPTLLDGGKVPSASVEQVIETLAARLGSDAIYTASLSDDHRPEKAWQTAMLSGSTPPGDWPVRPLWLLRTPRRATGRLTLEGLPERIENGWWDADDVRRDYFIGRDEHGVHFWVYRLRHDPEKLWIHGLFA